ncbi:2-amino-1-hydroxyethylphosphonate dioxygenase (glycine-forming) [Asticcacaulis sp. MM231]|uniref:HD domain-containing protein n=1 Tax=Asticcacaulis sp. MM231 TaxID=3157666 RepID=UPI0032D5AF84
MSLPDLALSPEPAAASDSVDNILHLYATRGDDHYGEDISQREHAEQCAYHAHIDGADDALIIAALLHDIGHLLHKFGEDAADRGIDTRHERIGSGWLARILPPSVTAPIALHVSAKRYLATTNPSYIEGLSEASLQSFVLQGGIMDPDEVDAFLADPWHDAAMQLRKYDELGKVVGADMPAFASYAPMIRSLLDEKAR